MPIIFLILSSIFLVSCSTTGKGKQEMEKEILVDSCEDLFALIEKKWVKNDSENCHILNLNLINQIKEHKDCFESMPRIRAEELFGKRPEQAISELFYDIYSDCNSIEGKKPLYRIRFIMELGPNIKLIVGCQVIKVNQ